MTWNVGECVELELTGFSHDGRAVAHAHNQPVVFTQGGLPGQRVLVELVSIKKRMAEGITRKVLDQVPAEKGGERPAPCIHAADCIQGCGGCPWQAMPYAEQMRWKRQLVLDSLIRIGKLDLQECAVRPVLSACTKDPAREWGYRNKMEFAFGPNASGSSPVLGLRRRASHEIIEVTDCLLQSHHSMKALATLRKLVAQSGLSAWDVEKHTGLRFAVIRELAGSENTPAARMVELITGTGDATFNAAVRTIGLALLEANTGEVTGFLHSVRDAESDVAYGEKTVAAIGETHLAESLRLCGHEEPVRFSLGHNAFFQVNSAATELLYNAATALVLENFSPGQQGTVWDVYSGVGGLAVALAPHFQRVMGLESVAAAVALARKNAGSLAQCRFETAEAARLCEYYRRYGTPDLLCFDPPRSGIDGAAVKATLQAKPRCLLLVSCNPATLARDLALFSTSYTINAIQPVDLFPQTPHIECIATLTLK